MPTPISPYFPLPLLSRASRRGGHCQQHDLFCALSIVFHRTFSTLPAGEPMQHHVRHLLEGSGAGHHARPAHLQHSPQPQVRYAYKL